MKNSVIVVEWEERGGVSQEIDQVRSFIVGKIRGSLKKCFKKIYKTTANEICFSSILLWIFKAESINITEPLTSFEVSIAKEVFIWAN